ncbi:hypothetical protein NSU02_08100 [Aeribacillus sp. FSL W8-0870]|uniref:hypothetical protein n=1 Tax=Aeribacillus sp. FSL W8-0870 TaxID=2954706 RepID=UPI0030CCF995
MCLITASNVSADAEQLERYRNGEKLEDILKEEEMMGKPKVISFNKYLEVLAERDELQKQLEELKANATQDKDDVQIEWLKHEADQAHKLLTEKEKEVEQLRELFETAMADKERLHKENLILENEVQRLKEANDELTAKNERYFADLMRLEQEVKGLKTIRTAKAPYRRLRGLETGAVYEEEKAPGEMVSALSS